MKKLVLSLLGSLVLLGLFFSCEKKEEAEKAEIAVTSVSLIQETAEMIIGETIQLQVSIVPSSATDKSVMWSSSKQTVATVTDSGLVTAISEGSSTITATVGGKSAKCQVTVVRGTFQVSAISLNTSTLTLEIGQSYSLKATVEPDDAPDKTVIWTTSNSAVVSVDANGNGVAIGIGDAIVSASSGNLRADCRINVIATWESINDALQFLFNSLIKLGSFTSSVESPINYGVLMSLFCNDLEGSDLWNADSDYNWFLSSISMQFDSTNDLVYTRYYRPWEIICDMAELIARVSEYGDSRDIRHIIGQAKALRAYCYLIMAQDFQFGPLQTPDAPCVPLYTEYNDDKYSLSRASVTDVYRQIIKDLEDALEDLSDYTRSWKFFIDMNVVHGLLARAYLNMGYWQEAYDHASLASNGYYPATQLDVSTPSFMDIDEHNWIWGYDMTTEVANSYRYATTSSWLRSFSSWSYAAGTGTYACINRLLYDRIPSTDVRKGWWVDEKCHSPLLDGLTWNTTNSGSASGQLIAPFEFNDKMPFVPYTNVKFGCNPIGTANNAEDMPLMRVEEMVLIQAETLCRLQKESEAGIILEDFVRKYRDSAYTLVFNHSLLDEIWFQRRVELWGEGFSKPDIIRFGKPLVRFNSNGSSFPDKFRFNLKPLDERFLIPIPEAILSDYPNLLPSTQIGFPSPGEGNGILDGITD